MADAEPLRRELSSLDATAVVIGAIVGVGIFFTPSRVAALAGTRQLALLAWGIGGLIALLGALTFAELGALVPRAGGQYELLRDAYGAATGFVYVVCNATATQAGATGVIALVCVDNLAVAIHGAILGPWLTLGCAIGLVLGVALANAAGVRWGARIQNLTVVVKLATLLAVAAVALLAAPEELEAFATAHSPARLHPVAGIAAALVPTLFTFGGWQQVLWMGGEVKRPERNLPISIIAGVSVVVGVYMLVNWAYLALLGHDGVAGSETLAADAIAVVFAGTGRRAIAVAVAVSAFGVLNAQLLTGPRLLFALARDGRLWPVLGRVHASRGTPVPAIAVLALAAIVLLVVAGADGVDRLLTGVVLVDGVFFALTGLASLVLARRFPHAERPVRMPGFPVVPLLFGVAELGVIVGAWLDPEVRGAAAIGAAWIAGALVLYLVRFRRQLTPRTPGPSPCAKSPGDDTLSP
ncbi:Serine/threonine exchanger SteT [Enhygromyxa salina]|uniref:Serine/threonine exchanger SteT n=1 Tax=Enhygromyxa salina TaxID=215803 RepID=A0A2S9YI72_9BACT|nr:amino acid permease [Enhygromyxa salina]PRQ04761.1 Serine/threonine exchanger SteT [Enhygromyxa salina]